MKHFLNTPNKALTALLASTFILSACGGGSMMMDMASLIEDNNGGGESIGGDNTGGNTENEGGAVGGVNDDTMEEGATGGDTMEEEGGANGGAGGAIDPQEGGAVGDDDGVNGGAGGSVGDDTGTEDGTDNGAGGDTGTEEGTEDGAGGDTGTEDGTEDGANGGDSATTSPIVGGDSGTDDGANGGAGGATGGDTGGAGGAGGDEGASGGDTGGAGGAGGAGGDEGASGGAGGDDGLPPPPPPLPVSSDPTDGAGGAGGDDGAGGAGGAGGDSGANPVEPTDPVDPCADGTCTANQAAWLDSFATPLGTTQNTNPFRNEFLIGGATRLDDGTLGYKQTLLRISALQGDALGGVAYFRGFDGPNSYHFYTGLTNGVNLGAPLTAPAANADTTAIWHGTIGYLRDTTVNQQDAFALNIDFAAATIGAFHNYVDAGTPTDDYFQLEGSYDTTGAITGTATYAAFTDGDPMRAVYDTVYTPGTLSGLIGERGAIGAFVSNNNGIGSRAFGGGFVVTPDQPAPVVKEEPIADGTTTEGPMTGGPSTEMPMEPMTMDPDPTDGTNGDEGASGGDTGGAGGAGGDEGASGGDTGGAGGAGGDEGASGGDTGGAGGAGGDEGASGGDTSGDTGVEPVEPVDPVVDPVEPVDPAVNTADFLASFNTPLGTAPSTDYENEFLQGGVSDLDAGTTRGAGFGSGEPIQQQLFIDTLAGNARGGVGLFRGHILFDESGNLVFDRSHYYAGLFADTFVGEVLPVSEADATVQWHGKISYQTESVISDIQDFVLDVNLQNRTVAGFHNFTTAFQSDSSLYFALDGTWDNNGVISGRALYANFTDNDPAQAVRDAAYTPGELRGIIGSEGAVGAFISNSYGVGNSPYAGGFVATPNQPAPVVIDPCANNACVVNQDDLLAGFAPLNTAPNTTPYRNEFLQGGISSLDAGDTRGEGFGQGEPTQHQLFIDTLNGDARGGVGFFRGRVLFDESGNLVFDRSHYYAGVFADTFVGEELPISDVDATAQWQGKISYQRLNDVSGIADFNLDVNLKNRTIAGFHNFTTLFQPDTQLYFALNGTWDDNGVIEGTALYAAFADDDPARAVQNGLYTPGDLRGIIGSAGAVGAFISNNDGIGDSPYAGGFVAVPNQ